MIFFMAMPSMIGLMNVSLVIGKFGQVGWLAYPTLSELKYSPGVGVDRYLWSPQLTSVNFLVTIVKMRAPGMTWMRMPIFTWTTFCSIILALATFPILAVTFALLAFDHYLGMHFFTSELGGNQMMYVNLIWA